MLVNKLTRFGQSREKAFGFRSSEKEEETAQYCQLTYGHYCTRYGIAPEYSHKLILIREGH